MAHHKLWYQGTSPYEPLKCDGKPSFTCPESRRIASEYGRDYYTLTNVINPNIFYDSLGVETWLAKELRDVKVGDTLWMVLVPPKHRIVDVFLYNEETTTEHSSLQSMGGISLSLITASFTEADDNGDCEMTNETNHGTIVMPNTDDAEEQFLAVASSEVTNPKTWMGVGIKVEALPNDRTLADIVGKIVVGTHTLGFDAQTFM